MDEVGHLSSKQNLSHMRVCVCVCAHAQLPMKGRVVVLSQNALRTQDPGVDEYEPLCCKECKNSAKKLQAEPITPQSFCFRICQGSCLRSCSG